MTLNRYLYDCYSDPRQREESRYRKTIWDTFIIVQSRGHRAYKQLGWAKPLEKPYLRWSSFEPCL